MRVLGHYKIISAAFVLSCVFSAGQAQPSAQGSAERTRLFERAQRSGPELGPYEFKFSVDNCNFQVGSDGRGQRLCVGSRRTNFRVAVEQGSYIAHLSYFSNESLLFVIYELTDEESGWGRAVALRMTTLTRRWSRNIPDFNIAEALVEDHFAYFAGVGFVGKLDLHTGRFIWRHNGLYERQLTYDGPRSPSIESNVVLFPSDDLHGHTRIVRVEKFRGRILSGR